MSTCEPCQNFSERGYLCGKNQGTGECDCPRCQGYCQCHDSNNDIIRMAREADDYADKMLGVGEFHPDKHDVRDERFAALVAAAEREACARLCELAYADPDAYGAKEFPYRVAMELSQLIRARGETK